MRITLTLVGTSMIISYSVLGALLMTNWAVAAASGVSLEEAVAEMQIANQPYSVVSGVIFTSLGGILAILWTLTMLSPKLKLTARVGIMIWAGVIALGAPAYFFASFGNMNSAGDTFFQEWDPAAALRLEAPLYLVSGIAAFTLAMIHASKRTKGAVS